tara:strand:- start:1213 stop:1767 length:555 start_codon:yes stop_codon:yes gene_type:complete
MQPEELFSQIEDKLEDNYYDKKTFRLIKKIYGEINDSKINDTKKSNKIILPFYGHIVPGKCYGIQKNYNLYTQCIRSMQKDNEYCKFCHKQSLQTETNKPVYGDIRDRKKQWSEKLIWKPKGHTKEVPFIDVVDKLQIDFEKIKKEIKKLGWRDIPECHLKRETKKKKKRKKQYYLCSSDEDEN